MPPVPDDDIFGAMCDDEADIEASLFGTDSEQEGNVGVPAPALFALGLDGLEDLPAAPKRRRLRERKCLGDWSIRMGSMVTCQHFRSVAD